VLRGVAVAGVAAAGAVVGLLGLVVAFRTGVRPTRYPGLSPEVSTSFAVVGTAVGAICWAIVRRRARRPRTVLRRAVAVVVAVAVLADAWVAVRMGWPGAVVLAAEHLVVVTMSVLVLRRVMPVPADDETRGGRWAELRPWCRWSLAAGLVVAAAVWTLVNKPVEGPILLVITYGHGVTLADLFAVAAVLAALHLVRQDLVGAAPRRTVARRRAG
jgi:multisubunit Na+/H+ antiporter MnhE subunit